MNNDKTQEMDSKTIAIISYLTLIGWIIAFLQIGKNKSPLALFHIRQSLFLMLCALVIWIAQTLFLVVAFSGLFLSALCGILMLGLFVLWLMGLLNAINGEQKPLPIFNNVAQDFLKGIN